MMNEQEAKEIIINDPRGDITARIDALEVVEEKLGKDFTMKQLWKWAEGGDKNNKEVL